MSMKNDDIPAPKLSRDIGHENENIFENNGVPTAERLKSQT